MKVKDKSEKTGLKLSFQKQRSWHPVSSFHDKKMWRNGHSDGFYFLGLQITVNSDCSHEIKRRLLLRRKVMTNLFQSSDITLLTNVHIVKTVVFQSSCIDGRVGQSRKLSAKELMLSNCDAGEDS